MQTLLRVAAIGDMYMGEKKYFTNVQGLRMIAIAMIFFSHTSGFLVENDRVVQTFSKLGSRGVAIFIAISGVLLAKQIEEHKVDGTLREGWFYALKKVKKIYWLHFTMWLVVLIMMVVRGEFELIRHMIYSCFNLTLTQDFIPFSGLINSFNGPSWYLSMCVFIWILTPIFCTITRRIHWTTKKNLSVIVSIILIRVVWISGSNYVINYVGNNYPRVDTTWFSDWLTYFCPLLCFLTYILAFFVSKLYSIVSSGAKRGMTLLGTLLCVLGSLRVDLSETWFFIGVTILVACLSDTENTIVSTVLSNKIAIYIGGISSYIFLIHGPVSLFVRDFCGLITVPYKFVLSLVLTILLSIVASKIDLVRAKSNRLVGKGLVKHNENNS